MLRRHGGSGCVDAGARVRLGGRSSRRCYRPLSSPHPGLSTPSDVAMQGSTVMRQSRAATLVTEEPDAFIAHVRVCGGAGWVTTGSTRKATGNSLCSCFAPAISSA